MLPSITQRVIFVKKLRSFPFPSEGSVLSLTYAKAFSFHLIDLVNLERRSDSSLNYSFKIEILFACLIFHVCMLCGCLYKCKNASLRLNNKQISCYVSPASIRIFVVFQLCVFYTGTLLHISLVRKQCNG